MNMKKIFYIETLGCKVNQYESDGIALGLESRGWEKAGSAGEAALFIINTCAVTSKAGMQSRQAVRRVIRENPEARVIVTGCHAQTARELIRDIDQVDQVICHVDKTKIAAHIQEICEDKTPLQFKQTILGENGSFSDFDHTVTGKMTRPYLKIQDGCNQFCSYCIVPYARGGSCSMPEADVFRHLKKLDQKGYREVIITGIHTGMYGLDLSPPTTLLALLKKINETRPMHRIRVSSIEPGELNSGIIELAQPDGVLCDHFHIPLQSGDDDILKKMRRPYPSSVFAEVVKHIKNTLPYAAVGADVLIGFPGETDTQFENTYRLIESLPVSYLHVFPFSPREGTPAWHFKPKVDSNIIKDRCAAMRALGRKKKKAFILSNLNRPLEGLIQNTPDAESGRLKAVTSNYITVLLGENQGTGGEIVTVIPEACDGRSLTVTGRITE